MPVLFIGHGTPMNGIEDNEYAQNWQEIAAKIPRPEVILCISAHWETPGTRVTAMDRPRTIHDFGGFPQALYQMEYPAPGSPDLAQHVQTLIEGTSISLDHQWGLDHGTWIVLRRMYPHADIPTFQLSLDYQKSPQEHYDLGQQLCPLREEGVLIIGSGNIVHNLGIMNPRVAAYDWATEFDETAKHYILAGNHQALINYPDIPHNQLAIPTNEHYLPLLYVLGLQEEGDILSFATESYVYGSLSMRCVLLE